MRTRGFKVQFCLNCQMNSPLHCSRSVKIETRFALTTCCHQQFVGKKLFCSPHSKESLNLSAPGSTIITTAKSPQTLSLLKVSVENARAFKDKHANAGYLLLHLLFIFWFAIKQHILYYLK